MSRRGLAPRDRRREPGAGGSGCGVVGEGRPGEDVADPPDSGQALVATKRAEKSRPPAKSRDAQKR